MWGRTGKGGSWQFARANTVLTCLAHPQSCCSDACASGGAGACARMWRAVQVLIVCVLVWWCVSKTWIDGGGGVGCAGYFGRLCDRECPGGASSPCSDSGRCLDNGDCECWSGYGGDKCQFKNKEVSLGLFFFFDLLICSFGGGLGLWWRRVPVASSRTLSLLLSLSLSFIIIIIWRSPASASCELWAARSCCPLLASCARRSVDSLAYAPAP